jgi:preprotein translocase subunit SecG
MVSWVSWSFSMYPVAAIGFSHYLFMVPLALLSVFLVLVILVQRGRGGGLTGALGGMGGQSAFGTKAGDLFTRITIVVAAIWVLLSMAALKVLNEQGSTGGLRASERGLPPPAATAPADSSKGTPPATDSKATPEAPATDTPAEAPSTTPPPALPPGPATTPAPASSPPATEPAPEADRGAKE